MAYRQCCGELLDLLLKAPNIPAAEHVLSTFGRAMWQPAQSNFCLVRWQIMVACALFFAQSCNSSGLCFALHSLCELLFFG